MKLTAVSHYESDMRNTVYLPVSLTPLSWGKSWTTGDPAKKGVKKRGGVLVELIHSKNRVNHFILNINGRYQSCSSSK